MYYLYVVKILSMVFSKVIRIKSGTIWLKIPKYENSVCKNKWCNLLDIKIWNKVTFLYRQRFQLEVTCILNCLKINNND